MKRALLLSLLCALLLQAVLHGAVVPKDARTLGLSVAPADDGDYPRALAAAQVAGVQSTTLSLDWSRLEVAPGRYDNTLLTIAEGFYPPRHVPIDLILRPIDTNRAEIPPDLKGKRFDAPTVIARFERLLDDVFAQSPHLTLHSLVIGNEVDVFLGREAARWGQYQTFYRVVSAYARAKRPGLRVGVAATFDGLTGETREPLRRLNAASDVIAATYYPLNNDFTVRPPASPGPDLARLCGLYPGRRVMLVEAGYPSSRECGSSEAEQATFVRSLFSAWDAHASQIISITFSWETDISPTTVAADTRYYGVSTDAFAAFLGSLGLRTRTGSGRDKPAFTALGEEAHIRGW